MKKEIIWNNENWILDYETGTVYKNGTLFENDSNLLTVQAKIGDYPITKFGNAIYFKTETNFYKIVNDEVVSIEKEEIDKLKEYVKSIKLNPRNLDSVRFVSNYVVSALIDEIIKRKYNINVSINFEPMHISAISKKFTYRTKKEIEDISRFIISESPRYYNDKKSLRENVKNKFSKLLQEDKSNDISRLIDEIYENDQVRWDFLADDIKKSINRREENQSGRKTK